MAEEQKGGMELLAGLMGEQGKDALQMIQRMERLKRLMGTAQPNQSPVPAVKEQEEGDIFARSRNESMLSAAIPFLNQEYQKELYIVVRLMEMRRVLSGGFLQTREKQQEEPSLRRKQMLHAMRPYLGERERNQLDTILKMMDMKMILEQEGKK